MCKTIQQRGSFPRAVIVLSSVLASVCYAQNITERTDPVPVGNGTNVIGVKYPNYDAFYGIPFAEPPVGQRRFANPVKKVLPSGDFLADNVSQACLQPDVTDKTNQRVVGSEDCLYLNIYRPNTNKTKTNYDVLFFVHGGAYFLGSSNPLVVGPSYLMNNGSVILVTPQYRLNTLGFLSTGDAASPGNYALKDQTLALKWVKDNIKSFGGNPDSITIAGQSAGAGSVHMLMMSPLSKDLIKGVIAMSGPAISAWNYPTEDPLNLTRRHAKILNVNNADNLNSTRLVDKLRQLPAEDIIRTVPQMKIFGLDPLTLYRPVVEPNNTEGAFLTQSPYEVLKRGGQAKVPVMFSVVPNDGGVRALDLAFNQTQREAFNKDMETLIPFLMELRLNGTKAQNFTKQVQERYNLTKGITDKASETAVQRLFTDRAFAHPTYRSLQLHLNTSQSPVYFHNFTYRGQNSTSDLNALNRGRDNGVVHGDDLLYLFESRGLFPGGLNEQDKAASEQYVNYIVQFVMDRKPPGNVQCKEMNPMCSYVSFYKNPTTGAMERETRSDFDMEMVKFWDQTGEIPL